jgi:hypothetical protein
LPDESIRLSQQRCIGSSVPGDYWEYGHPVLAGTETQMFPENVDGTGSTYFRHRCFRCRSTLYYFQREDCAAKAQKTWAEHAKKYVKRGFAEDEEHARLLLTRNGVTPEWIASDVFVPAFGNPCPGLCCHAYLNERGVLVIEQHIITIYPDLHFDWRDPRYPLTPENAGPLCGTCNPQKGEDPWPKFMARQRAILSNLRLVNPDPAPLRLF